MPYLLRREALAACAMALGAGLFSLFLSPATADTVTMLRIEVAGDVEQQTAHLVVDDEIRASIAPGCAVVLSVEPGEHTLAYTWPQGSITHRLTLEPGDILGIIVRKGPTFDLIPAQEPLPPVCA